MKKSQILGASVLSISLGVGLAAYAQSGDFDISQQIGPNPVLPEPTASLLPDLKVAEVVGWKDGETPAVPNGLTVTAYAKDLANPRTVHTLPNGDVLVIQSRGPSGKPTSRPKDLIRGWIMTFYMAGPIYIAALSHFFLGEKIGWRRWLAVLIGFAGVVIALRPSTAMLSLPSLFGLAGSFAFALSLVMSRYLRSTSDTTLVT